MALFYQLFIKLYPLIIRAASFNSPKANAWIEGRLGIFDKIAGFAASNTKPIIWLHCASLGEFEQGLPIAEKIKKSYPSHAMVISFFSPSGYEVRANHPVSDFSFYLPMDSKKNAEKLVELLNPQLVIFVKYEFWYHYLKTIHHRKIPCLLVSAVFRKTQPFFAFYGSFYRKMLHYFTAILVQDSGSKNLLDNIGFQHNTIVSGDTRFDRVIDIAAQAGKFDIVEEFTRHQKAIVCGSTWPGDDRLLKEISGNAAYPKFIIAPHNVHENSIRECLLVYKHAVTYSSWSKLTDHEKNKSRVLIIDNVGMLSALYQYAILAYVGGGFDKTGIHNTLEAAVFGVPVVFGPRYQKYLEAVELVKEGGAVSVNSKDALEAIIKSSGFNLQSGEIAKAYVERKSGATSVILDYIQANRLLTN